MRSVRVDTVEIVEWMTLAVAVGVNIESDEVVTFALPKEDAAQVRWALEQGQAVVLEVGSLRVLRAVSPSG